MTVRGAVPLKPERPEPESRQETWKLSSANLLLIGTFIQPLSFAKDDHAPSSPAFTILYFRKRAEPNFIHFMHTTGKNRPLNVKLGENS